SFILPLATLELLGTGQTFVPSIVYYPISFFGAVILSSYLSFDPSGFLISSFSSIGVPLLFLLILKKYGRKFSTEDLYLSNFYLFITFLVMLFPYIYTFPLLRGQKLVDLVTLSIIFFFYGVGILGFVFVPPAQSQKASVSPRLLVKPAVFFLVAGLVVSLLGSGILLNLVLLSIMVIGLFIFASSIVLSFLKGLKYANENH
ncbi:MAG: hypothetical protein D6732_17055, partial [Methanobacteriota archaeon]